MNVAACLSVLVAISACTAFADPTVWSQPPGFLIYTNDPAVRGGDRASTLDWNRPSERHPAIADDFVSDGYRILRLRWWGSYFPGYEPTSETNFFEEAYVFSFFLDFTNRPRALVGMYIAPISVVTITPTAFTGGDGHPIFQYEVQVDQTCLACEALPDAEAAGFHGIAGRRYWLSIQAAVGRRYSSVTNQFRAIEWTDEPTSKTATNNFWGWHTSPTNRASASVSGQSQLDDTNLVFSAWQTNPSLYAELDQAVEILTGCDDTPPRMISVTAYCAANVIKVTFDEKLDPLIASDPFNYRIYSPDIELSVVRGQVDESWRTVWLGIDSSTPIPCGHAFEVAAYAIVDMCGNVFSEEVLNFQCAPCSDPLPGLCSPIRLNYERLGPYVSLSWNSTNYVLESATSLNEGWTLTSPTSPFVLFPGSATSFFRLKCLK